MYNLLGLYLIKFFGYMSLGLISGKFPIEFPMIDILVPKNETFILDVVK